MKLNAIKIIINSELIHGLILHGLHRSVKSCPVAHLDFPMELGTVESNLFDKIGTGTL